MSDDALRAVYESATGFDEFLARVRPNAERFHAHHERLDAVARDPANAIFQARDRILVLCEPYCGDCVINLPLIARLAEASGNATLRVASRDTHRAVADRFPGRGGVSRVPTLLLLDADWQLVGHWSERGASDHDWMAAFTRADPLPEITLEDGMPAGAFATWLGRRLEAQLPVFYAHNWTDVRDELAALAEKRPVALAG